MVGWHKLVMTAALFGAVVSVGGIGVCDRALAENEGLPLLDDALREKVNATGLRDISKVIDLLQKALDQGLEVEDAEFAEDILSNTLMERATALVQVINTQSIIEPRVQQVRQLVVSDLRRVLAYDQPPPQAHFLLGRLMALPGGDPHEARRSLTTYLENTDVPVEQRAAALVLRARVQTDQANAMADFDEAVRLLPDNASYRLMRAVFLRSQDKFEQALLEVEQVLAQMPDDANALILQGEVFRSLGKMDEALASFDEATRHAPQAPGPFQSRGEIYREQEKFDQAIEQFNKVIELQPGSLLTLVHRAEAYLYADRLEEALADVEVVLQKQPLIAAHRIRAEVLAKMNRLQEAIQEMEQVSEAMPKQAELKMQLALYYTVNEQPRRAISAYSDIIANDDSNFLAVRSRGDIYLNIGQHPEAVADLETALKLDPADSLVLNNLAWVLATSPVAEVRDAQRAIELATKACELEDYSKPHILSTLAAAFAEAGDFDAAIKWSQQAVDMNDPEHGEALAKELATYREGQPWREQQTVPDRDLEPEDQLPAAQAETPGQVQSDP